MKASGDEARQEARVIDVRVGENNGVDRCRVDREGGPVSPPQFLEPLKLTAINQNPLAISFEEIFGAGDSTRSSEKRQRCHCNTVLDWAKRAGEASGASEAGRWRSFSTIAVYGGSSDRVAAGYCVRHRV